MDKKRPGGEFGKRLKDRFIERENNEVGKGDGGIGPNPVFPIPPKNRFRLLEPLGPDPACKRVCKDHEWCERITRHG